MREYGNDREWLEKKSSLFERENEREWLFKRAVRQKNSLFIKIEREKERSHKTEKVVREKF